MQTPTPPLKVKYSNHKKEVSERVIMPLSVEYACTPHIQNPEWLLRATDLKKNEERLFVLENMSVMNTKIIDRHFCVTVYVKLRKQNRFLMLWHKKLQKWLPPGGHIDPHETPDTASVREVLEETGFQITLEGSTPGFDGELAKPLGVQLNIISKDQHEHIDLIYMAHLEEESAPQLNIKESEAIRWFDSTDILADRFDTFPSVKEWIRRLSHDTTI